jgi:GTPase Era involved in 16S rRNA processing
MPDPVTGSIGGTIIKASVGVVVKNTPLGLQKIGAWAKAKRILIIGQARAGKSTLFLTLQNGELFPEMNTPETRVPRQSGLISLGTENTGKVVSFKQVKDVPGHFSHFSQADLFRKTKAPITVILLDATRTDYTEWLSSFISELEKQWNVNKRKQNFKNGNLVILLNKMDKAIPLNFQSKITEMENIVKTSDFLKINNFNINILPSSLVTNGFNDMARSVIQTLLRLSMD